MGWRWGPWWLQMRGTGGSSRGRGSRGWPSRHSSSACELTVIPSEAWPLVPGDAQDAAALARSVHWCIVAPRVECHQWSVSPADTMPCGYVYSLWYRSPSPLYSLWQDYYGLSASSTACADHLGWFLIADVQNTWHGMQAAKLLVQGVS